MKNKYEEQVNKKIIRIITSGELFIGGTLDAEEIIIKANQNTSTENKVEFSDTQKAQRLTIENVEVKGNFIAPVVSINENSKFDIALDVEDKTKCTYLLIDVRNNNVCGNIKMTESFFNQMSIDNKKFLTNIVKNEKIKIKVEGTLFQEYDIPSNRIATFTYDELLRDLKIEQRKYPI